MKIPAVLPFGPGTLDGLDVSWCDAYFTLRDPGHKSPEEKNGPC
jgi:hypothetical protein